MPPEERGSVFQHRGGRGLHGQQVVFAEISAGVLHLLQPGRVLPAVERGRPEQGPHAELELAIEAWRAAEGLRRQPVRLVGLRAQQRAVSE